MADEQISDMPSATTVADADVVPIVQSSTNKKSALSVIKTYLSTAFNALYVPLTRTLTINGDTKDLSANRSWTITPGTGDVVGPGSATDNAIARFDSTTGKLIQNSALTVADDGEVAWPNGVRQTFNPDGTTPGLNVGAISGDPNTPSNGDLWYDSMANELTARVNGANIALGDGDVQAVATLTTGKLVVGSAPSNINVGDLSGDVTTSGGTATTIANDAVTYAKQQNVSAASKLLGRGASGSGDPEEITLGTNLAMSGTTLNATAGGSGTVTTTGSPATGNLAKFSGATSITNGDLTGDITTAGALATTLAAGNAGNLNSGTLLAARMPAYTGDVTSSIGTVANTIANDAVTYAKMQNVSAASTLLGRGSAGGSGDPEEISVGSNLTLSGTTLSATAQSGSALNAAGPNSTIAINVLTGAPANIVTKSITYAAGDHVTIRVWGAFLNNSGSNATYAVKFNLGTLTATITFGSTTGASSTARQPAYIEVTFAVASTSAAWVSGRTIGGVAVALGAVCQLSTAFTYQIFQKSASNLTGAQTTSVQIFSTTNTATQSFELNAWRIEKVSSNP